MPFRTTVRLRMCRSGLLVHDSVLFSILVQSVGGARRFWNIFFVLWAVQQQVSSHLCNRHPFDQEMDSDVDEDGFEEILR
eukprot:485843-Amphidinium_carterae.1